MSDYGYGLDNSMPGGQYMGDYPTDPGSMGLDRYNIPMGGQQQSPMQDQYGFAGGIMPTTDPLGGQQPLSEQMSPNSPVPARQPSLFQQIIQGAMLGMAYGANQNTPGAAFSAGAQGYMAYNEQQRQIARQQEQDALYKQQVDAKIAESHIQTLKEQMELDHLPDEYRQQHEIFQKDMYAALGGPNSTAAVVDTDSAAMNDWLKNNTMDGTHLKDGRTFTATPFGGKTFIQAFSDPNQPMPQGTVIRAGNYVQDASGWPLSQYISSVNKITDNYVTMATHEFDRNTAIMTHNIDAKAQVLAAEVRNTSQQTGVSANNQYDEYMTAHFHDPFEYQTEQLSRLYHELDILQPKDQFGQLVTPSQDQQLLILQKQRQINQMKGSINDFLKTYQTQTPLPNQYAPGNQQTIQPPSTEQYGPPTSLMNQQQPTGQPAPGYTPGQTVTTPTGITLTVGGPIPVGANKGRIFWGFGPDGQAIIQ